MKQLSGYDNYIQRVQAGIDYIEESLEQNIDICDVANVACMSRWHFQRMFRALTGDTVKCYIRTRRMSNALEALLQTDRPILDIAVASGFESQESFTRAFNNNFGITPGKFRDIGNSHQFMRRIRMDANYLEHVSDKVSKEPIFERMQPKSYVGMQTSYYGADSERNNIGSKLQDLWAQFLPRLLEVDNKDRNVGYGIVHQTKYDSELLNYLAAIEVFEKVSIPNGMVSLTLAESDYAVFEHKGKTTKLDDTVNYIYATWLPHSGYQHTEKPDIEIYGEGYITDSENSLIYYAIPVAKV